MDLKEEIKSKQSQLQSLLALFGEWVIRHEQSTRQTSELRQQIFQLDSEINALKAKEIEQVPAREATEAVTAE